MVRSVIDELMKIGNTRSIAELIEESEILSEAAGYAAKLYVIYPPIGLETSQPPAAVYSNGYPTEWAKEYLENELYKTDPVLKHVFRTHKAVLARDIDISMIPTALGRQHAKKVLATTAATGLIVPAFVRITRMAASF